MIGEEIMDFNGNTYKCEHSKYECPYKDCNYHVKSTGRYSHIDPKDLPIWFHLPTSEEEAKWCSRNLDI